MMMMREDTIEPELWSFDFRTLKCDSFNPVFLLPLPPRRVTRARFRIVCKKKYSKFQSDVSQSTDARRLAGTRVELRLRYVRVVDGGRDAWRPTRYRSQDNATDLPRASPTDAVSARRFGDLIVALRKSFC